MATIVIQFDDGNFDVDNKGKYYQQFRFLFELSTIHRKQTNISVHSHVVSFKPISGSESGVRQDIKLLRIKFEFNFFLLRRPQDVKRRSQDIQLLSRIKFESFFEFNIFLLRFRSDSVSRDSVSRVVRLGSFNLFLMFHLYPSDVYVNSDNVSRVDLDITNSTFTSRFHPGSNSTTDTNDNPYIVPTLLPSYDPNHHHERYSTPYVGRHSIPRIYPGYS